MPRGRPLDETEEEVREAALIGEADVAEARVWARRHLPEPFRRLGEAKPITAEEIKELREANDLPEL